MKTYTYSEARQQFATVLDEAWRAGQVRIRRRDGQVFVVQPAASERSPLDVPGVDIGLEPGEVVEWLRAEKEDSGGRLLERSGLGKKARSHKRTDPQFAARPADSSK